MISVKKQTSSLGNYAISCLLLICCIEVTEFLHQDAKSLISLQNASSIRTETNACDINHHLCLEQITSGHIFGGFFTYQWVLLDRHGKESTERQNQKALLTLLTYVFSL